MILRCLTPNCFYTFGLGTCYSPCLQVDDQFTWFTHQLLTTSGCGRCSYKPFFFHLERLRSHYAYVEVSMLYGVNAFNRTVVYLLPSDTAVESYTWFSLYTIFALCKRLVIVSAKTDWWRFTPNWILDERRVPAGYISLVSLRTYPFSGYTTYLPGSS